MTALGTLTGKVLIQIGDGDPIEIGTVEFSVEATDLTLTP